MISKNTNWELIIEKSLIQNYKFYTDRNWVFNCISSNPNIKIIRNTLNNLNEILLWNLNVISNESEVNRSTVLKTDEINWIELNDSNYKLSTQSAAKFILEKLGYNICYFTWNDEVWEDIKKSWLNIINIKDFNINDLLFNGDIPILFARPQFAINSKFNDDNEIMENIFLDSDFEKIIHILDKFKAKVVFCHTKENCKREKHWNEFQELNLWFYFDLLVKAYWLKVWEDVFDLWKWNQSNWEFFDMALWIKEKTDYKKIIWIWDMYTDLEYTLENWWFWILVESWDQVITESIREKQLLFKWRFFNILDLSYLKFI